LSDIQREPGALEGSCLTETNAHEATACCQQGTMFIISD